MTYYYCNFKTRKVVAESESLVGLMTKTSSDPDCATVTDLDFWGITK